MQNKAAQKANALHANKCINLLRLSQLLCDFAPFELLHHSKALPLLSLTSTSLAFYALLVRVRPLSVEASLELSDCGGTLTVASSAQARW